MSATQDHQEDPPLTATDMKFAAIMATMEEDRPGFSGRCVMKLEDDNLHREVRRLGCAAPDPSIAAEGRKALKSMVDIRAVVLGHVEPKRKGKARG